MISKGRNCDLPPSQQQVARQVSFFECGSHHWIRPFARNQVPHLIVWHDNAKGSQVWTACKLKIELKGKKQVHKCNPTGSSDTWPINNPFQMHSTYGPFHSCRIEWFGGTLGIPRYKLATVYFIMSLQIAGRSDVKGGLYTR